MRAAQPMSPGTEPNVTALLARFHTGDRAAVDQVFPVVYAQLRAIAANRMRQERLGHTLSATALVHEAYVKIAGQERVDWKNRAHFFAVAAMAMRRILLTHAEKRCAQKRGGDQIRVTLDEQKLGIDLSAEGVLTLDRALKTLAQMNDRQAKVVELRFFAGLSHEEIAEVIGVSVPTVGRDWRIARAWLGRELRA